MRRRSGPRRLAADREVAEAGELHFLAREQRRVDQVEEGLDHVLRLALVQPQLVEQDLGELGLGRGLVGAVEEGDSQGASHRKGSSYSRLEELKTVLLELWKCPVT